MQYYKVIEKFTSVNGEGLRSGELTTFIRFYGCNLRCAFCDSKYTYSQSEPFELLTAQQILDYIKSTGIRNVTLAGGEPLYQPHMKELLQLVCGAGYLVEIETNGAINIAQYMDLPNRPSFTLDYKTGCSGGMEQHMDLSNYKHITKHDSVKFVVATTADLDTMRRVVAEHDLIAKTNVLVSPCYGDIELVTIVEYLKAHNLNGIKLQIQLHKYIWDADMRGV